jgi:hypothetical protein
MTHFTWHRVERESCLADDNETGFDRRGRA